MCCWVAHRVKVNVAYYNICVVLLQMAPSTILTSCKQDYQLQKTLESYGNVWFVVYCINLVGNNFRKFTLFKHLVNSLVNE